MQAFIGGLDDQNIRIRRGRRETFGIQLGLPEDRSIFLFQRVSLAILVGYIELIAELGDTTS